MQWPNGMEPEHAAVHVRNELFIPAAPERVWRWLCRAVQWPEWYPNCAWVRLRSGSGPDLGPASAFTWKTFGVRVRSTVRVYEPFRELGWDAAAFGLHAYHGWLIEPQDSGSQVITEETQNGPLTAMGRWHLRRILSRNHRTWLEALSNAAAGGDPG
ncbi:MAG: SRPBCC family protein [Candidatus Binataceae bacterium]